jgi:hypothetical protein
MPSVVTNGDEHNLRCPACAKTMHDLTSEGLASHQQGLAAPPTLPTPAGR